MEQEAREYVETLSPDEALAIAAPIVEMNVRPLMARAGNLTSILGGSANGSASGVQTEQERQT